MSIVSIKKQLLERINKENSTNYTTIDEAIYSGRGLERDIFLMLIDIISFWYTKGEDKN
jgi:hypothetical protein